MKSQKTSMAILSTSLVIVMLGFGIAIPLMPFYVTHFGASGTSLGLMMSLYSFMQFLFAPLWGRLSDRIGRKPVLLIGIAGFAISFFLQGIAQNLVEFTVWRTLAGILSAAALPTAMAYVADTTSLENRSRGVGMLGAAMGLGMIFGPLLGGFLTHVTLPVSSGLQQFLQVTTDPSTGQTINLSIPFFVSSLLALVDMIFVMLLLPESLPASQRVRVAPGAKRQSGTRSQSGGILEALRGPSGFLYALAFLIAFALANMEAVLALFGRERFNMGPTQVGMLMGAMGILSVIQQGMVIGPLTRRVGEVRIIQGGLVVAIIGFVGLAWSPTLWIMVASTLIFTSGNVLLQPSVTSLISKKAPSGQGSAMGMNNAYQSLGRGVGPLWAGVAFDFYSTLSFWTGALVQTIAFVYSLRLLNPDDEIVSATTVQNNTGTASVQLAAPAALVDNN